MDLSLKTWLKSLSDRHTPARERVVQAGTFKKSIRFPKNGWTRLFQGSEGAMFKRGSEVGFVPPPPGVVRVEIPGWVHEQLGTAKDGRICVTLRDGKCYIKKMLLEEHRSGTPACMVVDEFEASLVTRHYSLPADPMNITDAMLRDVLAGVGRFRVSPVPALLKGVGRVSLLTRKEVGRKWNKANQKSAVALRADVVSEQGPSGSWQDSAVLTGFGIIRLLELGATPRSAAVKKGIEWLLSTSQPPGFPGCWMVSQEAAEAFQQWKDTHSGKARGPRTARKSEIALYDRGTELLGGTNSTCEIRLTCATAVALEALLRCGLSEHKRVARAINSLLNIGGPGWCGCGYFVAEIDLPDSADRVDFNRSPRACPAKKKYCGWPVRSSYPWLLTRDQVVTLACEYDATHKRGRYHAWKLGRNSAVILRRWKKGDGNCTFAVNRALSWHPGYQGSTLQLHSALSCETRQGWNGSWGVNGLSYMFSLLERFDSPLARFLALRSIPLLVKTQREDGLWEDQSQPVPGFHTFASGTTPEQTSLAIVRALKRFGFLRSLIPQ